MDGWISGLFMNRMPFILRANPSVHVEGLDENLPLERGTEFEVQWAVGCGLWGVAHARMRRDWSLCVCLFQTNFGREGEVCVPV